MQQLEKPDFLFEISWEVCNKVGGINTVIATKALRISERVDSGYIMIGPDIHSGHLSNDVFTEDNSIYPQWVSKARMDGFHFRIGHWHVQGNPIAVLLDFSGSYSKKDEVFKDLWEKYKLDSLYGGWDYIEPTLFGYEAGRLIEHFYNYNVSAEDHIVAHFHEWMTGAGILYLKDRVPQAGRVFTTHATVMGRSVAGMNLPLYSKIEEYNPEFMARELNVLSKFSLEKLSAQHADIFTTVSEITGKECTHFLSKTPDLVTPNGFEDTMVPVNDEFNIRREASRKLLKNLSRSVLGKEVADNTLFIINSGRYEFRNKGIDLFIEALANLKYHNKTDREIVAIIAVPANNAGVRQEVKHCMTENIITQTPSNLTHYLFNEDNDAIMQAIRNNGLQSDPESNVNLIFIPSYLDGDDGLLNFNYYDFLIGCDLSVFPSYYEPWGYTPLEAVAFHIPTITTTLAGFGVWMLNAGKTNGGVKVIERDDYNTDFVVSEISRYINEWSKCSDDEFTAHRQSALNASHEALWQNLAKHYFDAYHRAIQNTLGRKDHFSKKTLIQEHVLEKSNMTEPNWRKIFVKPELPERLNKLMQLSKNIWWTWSHSALKLFESINPHLWERSGYNPLAMLELMSYKEIEELSNNPEFLVRLDFVYREFEEYMNQPLDTERPSVAYFCMEYGFHTSLKLYSGGLGVLAGDYLKQASDSKVRMTAIGLLFRYGYFNQSFSAGGEQISEYIPQKFSNLPMIPVRDDQGNWIKISVSFPGRLVLAKVWEVQVGRVKLFLLDTDIEDNNEADHQITHQLYGGDWENRMKQEILLGIGGVKILKQLGLTFDIYHCNEGHAAFSVLERIKDFVQNEVMSFQQALEIVRAQTLFTTHTPVPAGHDAFSEDLMRIYFAQFPEKLNLTWKEFVALGRQNPDDANEKFSMSILAMSGSQEVNGVSRIHGRVTREMFKNLYNGFFSEELYINYVTNGVHLPTWGSHEMLNLAKKYDFDYNVCDQANPESWEFINRVPDNELWDMRKSLKSKLLDMLRNKLVRDMTHRQEAPRHIINVMEQIDENALYIGFARRFATYKRAHLLFKNLDKLRELVNKSNRPLRFVYAGKAHPADKAGQDYIKHIIEISRMPEFAGKIIFVENYDMEIARLLLAGVDVWLNTPTRPLEASGTSGIKACLNGVLNLSVLDGWWAEGYVPKGGWALKEARTYDNQTLQDELDSETLYNLLEEEILPLYFKRDENNIPTEWLNYIRKNFTAIAPHFTMKRMLDEYYSKFYFSQQKRSSELIKDNYAAARALSSWKRRVMRNWDQITACEISYHDSTAKPLMLGQDFVATITLNTGELRAEDLALDIIFGQKEMDQVEKIIYKTEMKVKSFENGQATYEVIIPNPRSGVFDFAFRLRPSNPLLPHLQDFNLVKWL